MLAASARTFFKVRRVRRFVFLLFLFISPRVTLAEVTIRLVTSADASSSIHVDGLSKDALQALESQTAIQRNKHFRLFVDAGAKNSTVPSVLGECSVEGQRLIFRPRFGLMPGQVYRAEFLSSLSDQPTSHAIIQLPKANVSVPTRVVAIYPSATELPQNLLKFYLHFSAPMEQGNVYRYIDLSIENGEKLAFPFLELAEELWDPTGTRLTLLLDPGRVKRGLVPREEDGAIFEIGKTYRLTIRAEWPDAHGMPLDAVSSKRFTVIGEDYEQPNPIHWKVIPPTSSVLATKNGTNPIAAANRLEVYFPEPLDHALLSRCLVVVDSNGQTIQGEIAIVDKERRWLFTPRSPWNNGEYTLQINTLLEDLAGNSIARPFEVDLSKHTLESSGTESRRFVVP